MGYESYIGSSFLQTARQRAAGMIALLAILLHVAAPMLYELSSPATQGLMQMTICAGGEAKDVFIDQNGKPVQPTPSSHHECRSCISHCAALVVSIFSTTTVRWVSVFATPALPLLAFELFLASAHPRGPPA